MSKTTAPQRSIGVSSSLLLNNSFASSRNANNSTAASASLVSILNQPNGNASETNGNQPQQQQQADSANTSGSLTNSGGAAANTIIDMTVLDNILRAVVEPQSKFMEQLLQNVVFKVEWLQMQNAKLQQQNTELVAVSTQLQGDIDRLSDELNRVNLNADQRLVELEAWKKSREAELTAERERPPKSPPALSRAATAPPPLRPAEDPLAGVPDAAALSHLFTMQHMAAMQQQAHMLAHFQHQQQHMPLAPMAAAVAGPPVQPVASSAPADPMRAMMQQYATEGRQPVQIGQINRTAAAPQLQQQSAQAAPNKPAAAAPNKQLPAAHMVTGSALIFGSASAPKTTSSNLTASPGMNATTNKPSDTTSSSITPQKSSPFTGFTGLSADAAAKPTEQKTTAPVFAGFGSPATASSSTFSFQPTSSTVKADSTTPVANTTSNTLQATARTRTESEEHAEHFEPNVEFTPVVPLPDLVEKKTGEEDETVLFNARAKLYRYAADSGEYKERGVGDLKLLRHKQTDKVRLLLRREQVHKLAANHLVCAGQRLRPMQSSSRAFVWTANDYAEEELKMETFAARFKTDDEADEFRRVFEKCVAELDAAESAEPTATTKSTTSSSKKTEESTKANSGGTSDKTANFLAAFQPAAGSWECETCLTRNDKARTECVCCETPKAGGSTAAAAATDRTAAPSSGNLFKPTTFTSNNSSGGGGFSFGFGAGAGKTDTTANPAPSADSTTSSITFKPSTLTATPPRATDAAADKPSSSPLNFSFKLSPAKTTAAAGTTAAAVTTVTGAGGSITVGSSAKLSTAPVGTPTTGFTFGQPAASSKGPALSFGQLAAADNRQAPAFSTHKPGLLDKPQAKLPHVGNTSATAGDDEEHAEHFEPNVEFTPVVPLPDLVDKKTGEEDEHVLFCARAKLYRYAADTKEYKERGVGDLKLLEHKDTKKVRLILRREQVHKLAANHLVCAGQRLRPMQSSSRAFVWTANDYAEEELKVETFAARFKTDEQAEEFRKTFEAAVSRLETSEQQQPTTDNVTDVSTESDRSIVKPFVMSQASTAGANSTFYESTDGGAARRSVGEAAEDEGAAGYGPDDGYEGQDSEQYEDDYYANTCVFQAQATLHTTVLTEGQQADGASEALPAKAVGHVKMMLDDDLDPDPAFRLFFDANEELQLANHVVVKQLRLDVSTGKSSPWYCRWEAYDFALPHWRRCRFRLDFGNSKSRDEFAQRFKEGVAVADKCNFNEFEPEESVGSTPFEETEAFRALAQQQQQRHDPHDDQDDATDED